MGHRAVTVSLSLDEFEMWQGIQSRLRRMDVQANNSTPFRAGRYPLRGGSRGWRRVEGEPRRS